MKSLDLGTRGKEGSSIGPDSSPLGRDSSRPAESPAAPPRSALEGPELARSFGGLLERQAIDYVVVGGGREVAGNPGRDTDLVVPRHAWNRLPALLVDFCREHDVRLVQALQHEASACSFVLAWPGKDGRPSYLLLDVCSDYLRSGRLLMRAGDLLDGRERGPGGQYRPAPAREFLYYLLKKIDKGDLDCRHEGYLEVLFRRDPQQARELLRQRFRAAEADLLGRAAAAGEWAEVRESLGALRLRMRQVPARSPLLVFNELLRWVARVRRPTGLTIALLGPDGAGKSSVIERVERDLAPAFRRTRRYHLRPHFGRIEARGLPVTEPHSLPLRSPLPSMGKLAIWWLDYTLGFASAVWPDSVRSTLTIFDRYCHDLLVDPRRYRYGGPRWLPRWLCKLVPRPDLIVVLDAPAEVLHRRKHEVPLSETRRQRRAYAELKTEFEGVTLIDASRPLEAVAAAVESRVLALLSERAMARAGRG